MEIDVILCNHAEAAENKVFLTGGGVNTSFVGPEPPHVVTVSIGGVIHVPYQSTNQAHTLSIDLIDAQGQPVSPFQPEAETPVPPVQAKMPFNVGRPPMIEVGDEQTLAVAANWVNLPLPALGIYEFIVSLDGTEMRRLPLRVRTLPPGVIQA